MEFHHICAGKFPFPALADFTAGQGFHLEVSPYPEENRFFYSITSSLIYTVCAEKSNLLQFVEKYYMNMT